MLYLFMRGTNRNAACFFFSSPKCGASVNVMWRALPCSTHAVRHCRSSSIEAHLSCSPRLLLMSQQGTTAGATDTAHADDDRAAKRACVANVTTLGRPMLEVSDWSQLCEKYKTHDALREMVIKRCRDMQVRMPMASHVCCAWETCVDRKLCTQLVHNPSLGRMHA